MEVNCIAEALPVSEAAGSGLESLDAAVGTFGMTVVHVQHDGIENAPEVLLDRPGHLLHRSQTVALRPP